MGIIASGVMATARSMSVNGEERICQSVHWGSHEKHHMTDNKYQTAEQK